MDLEVQQSPYGIVESTENTNVTPPSFSNPNEIIGQAPNVPTGNIPVGEPMENLPSITPMVDSIVGPQTEWSKLRSGGTSKEDAQAIIEQKYISAVKLGEDPVKVKEVLLGDGKVHWDRQKFEANEEIRAKVNDISVALNSIKINMTDLVTGNVSDESMQIVKRIGDYGLEQGWFKSYDPRKATAYLQDGTPIKMNDPSLIDLMGGNKAEVIGSIAFGILGATAATLSAPVTGAALAITAATGGYMGSMAGAYTGRVSDIVAQQNTLEDIGLPNEKMSGLDLAGEGAVAAITELTLGKTIEKIATSGTNMAKGLFQSLMGRNTTSAVKTVTDLTGLPREQLEKRAEQYAKAMGLELDTNNPLTVNNMILRNEIENNPSLQGYLTKVVEEPKIAQGLRRNVQQRIDTMSGIGTNTTSKGLLDMFVDSHTEASRMMGAVRGALDSSFDGTDLPLEQLSVHTSKIRQGLEPFTATIEEKNARSAMDKVTQSMQILTENPSVGNLFKLRTDFGSLLKKIGLFEENQATRSARLGTVDVPSLSSTYKAIDDHIDNVIKNTPYLNEAKKAELLGFKKSSDALYSAHMKAINTKWVKNLSKEGAEAKRSLDKLANMGKNGRTEYDSIMEALSKTNQDALEHSMVRRILDKSTFGEDGFSLVNAASDLRQLRSKIKNPQALNKIDAIEESSKLFQQDPIISMVANHRMVLDKLAKAGLTYNPTSSVLYAMWSKMFPRLQVALVELIEKTPILKHIAPYNPLYSAIKTSAKEINLTRAAEEVMIKGEQGSFKDFLDRALSSDRLPPEARRSIQSLSTQYAKLASSFEGNQAQVRDFMDAVKANPRTAGPLPEGAPVEKIAQLRAQGFEREAREIEKANAARAIAEAEEEARIATTLRAKADRIAQLEAKVQRLKDSASSDNEIYTMQDRLGIPRDTVERNALRIQQEARPNTPTSRTPSEITNRLHTRMGNEWSVNTNEPNHPVFHTADGSSFKLHFSGNTVKVSTSGLPNGGGKATKVYHNIWDTVEEMGKVYIPSGTLTNANPYRLSANMLSYIAKRGTDANHIIIGAAQRGSAGLAGKPLTVGNAKTLGRQLLATINRNVLPTGTNISSRTSDEVLQKISETTGPARLVRMGYKSLDLLRRLARTNNLTTSAAIMAVLLEQEDISSLLDNL